MNRIEIYERPFRTRDIPCIVRPSAEAFDRVVTPAHSPFTLR